MKDEHILGVHYGHDSTAVLIRNGEVVEAMSEERLSRCKKHVGFPHLSLQYIQKKYGVSQFDRVVVVGENAAWDGAIFTDLAENKRIRAHGPVRTKDFLRALGAKFPLL